MARFNIGNRVQLAGEIARFHKCGVGTVIETDLDSRAVLAQYRVRLADNTISTFFDFQLQSPPVLRAQIVLDTSSAGEHDTRRVHLVSAGIEIRLKIWGTRTVSGEVAIGRSPVHFAVVSLLSDEAVLSTKPVDDSGGFRFDEVSPGEMTLEVFVPGKRIVATLNV
jgi:hypothetical protein